MEVNTPIAEDIRITAQNSQYDDACKQILSEKFILAWIMKSCLEEYRDCDVKEIAERYIEGTPQVGEAAVMPGETNNPKIRGSRNEDTVRGEGRITYDIRFTALAPTTGEMIRLIINIEAQGKLNTGYPMVKRAIFHCSRMISAQYGTEFTHSEYGKIKKVYSIFICMAPPKKRQNSITRYRLVEENLVGKVKESVRNYDLLSVVMVCLGGADEENHDGVLKLLNVLLSPTAGEEKKREVLENDFGIPMTETLETEVRQMCNLSQNVMEIGIEKGMKQGIEQGIEKGMKQGIEKGKAEGLLASIRSLMANTGWPLEKALEILGVPEADRSKYVGLLQEQ